MEADTAIEKLVEDEKVLLDKLKEGKMPGSKENTAENDDEDEGDEKQDVFEIKESFSNPIDEAVEKEEREE